MQLAQNVPVQTILDQGFKSVYDYPYSHISTSAELENIKSQCNSNSLLCVGGSNSANLTNLLLVSCGPCLSILAQTTPNKPSSINGAYWYYSTVAGHQSFGFSPVYNISQAYCDSQNEGAEKRLCWHLTGDVGGYRLGTVVSLDNTTQYIKRAFLKTN